MSAQGAGRWTWRNIGRSEPQIDAKRAFTSTEPGGQASSDGTVDITCEQRRRRHQLAWCGVQPPLRYRVLLEHHSPVLPKCEGVQQMAPSGQNWQWLEGTHKVEAAGGGEAASGIRSAPQLRRCD